MKIRVDQVEYELDLNHQLALKALAMGYQYIHRAHGLRLKVYGLALFIGGAGPRWGITERGKQLLEENRPYEG